ncbi:MAG: MG2 domain-containing protein [Bdellovibrionota bacterium]
MIRLVSLLSIVIVSLSAFGGDVDPSGYSLYTGGKFYVLTDGVFSTDEIVKVRFEGGGNQTLKEYGGVDVRLYRIPKPLEFLRAQKNLHRPDVKGRYAGEGLSNVLGYLWDSWYKKARLAWQRVFSTSTRKAVVAAAPELSQAPAHSYKTNFSKENQFKPMPGMEIVDSFRYPVWEAKPNTPPKDTAMEGSSSNFIETRAGNVLLPMGKRKPGLYLVEAVIGSFRATTLVFVSDSVVVTKVSSNQALVWTVHRATGVSRPKSKVVLTDGVGVLDQGSADDDGVYVSKRSIPERTFAMVEDQAGGVAVSENFFYDSEVFQSKIYLFTDRPLYQPDDTVSVRALGRDLKRDGAREIWSALTGSNATLTIVDASGVPILSQPLAWKGAEGGEAKFKIPSGASSGGYTMKLRFEGEDYGGVFRVARFTKPHFDAQIQFDKASYKVGEAVKGRVVLTYPSGQPVVGADVDLQLREEQMTVYEGSYGYNGASPIELKQKSYTSNSKGEVAFTIPAAKKPSRYIATARALDQAAYRVTTKKEVLIEGYLETYLLTSDFNATQPGAPVKITFSRQGSEAADVTQKLKTWQAIRLEDRSVTFGPVPSVDRGEFTLTLAKPGHYVVRVVDVGGVTRGVRSHIVLGPGSKSTTGQVEIVADRESYEIGETAKLILTFPGKAEDALLTLERNEVSSYGRLAKAAKWFKAERVGDTQWKIDVPIEASFAPNVIFSVASSFGGEFGFQNKGLVVKKPTIDITFKPNKTTYAPGEKVVIDMETKMGGKALAAMVAVGVVDEMIYVLQPEIAPPIGDFFHHLRRNQVRTTSSLSFYSFNPATSDVATDSSSAAHRDLKLMQERARRDTRDTAFWNGKIKTDANGKARFEFVMPDALTRWRITARAISITGTSGSEGAVGESKGYLLSNQDYYLKWTGPTRFRSGDKPRPAIIAFNSTDKSADGELAMKGPSYTFSQKISMKPGANTIVLEKIPDQPQEIESRLTIAGASADVLATSIDFIPAAWLQTQSQMVRLEKGTKLALPATASRVRVKAISDSAYQFQRIADDLMEYPWGCVEQTSSRLIPMVMAVKALDGIADQEPIVLGLRDRIASERRRLVSMAGPNAVFTWWGDGTAADLFMTAHAYHADWRASKLLGITVPKENWEHLLKVYAEAGSATAFEKAYALWVLSYIGQPVTEQVKALAKQVRAGATSVDKRARGDSDSVILDSQVADDVATMILGNVAVKSGAEVPAVFKARLDALSKVSSWAPAFRAVQLAYAARIKTASDPAKTAEGILNDVKFETPTIDRAIALAFVEEALPQATTVKKAAKVADVGPDWKRDSKSSVVTFNWKGKGLPATVPVVSGAMGEVIYDALEEPKSTLDVTVERKLYRVIFDEVKQASEDEEDEYGAPPLKAVEVSAKDAFDTRSLYIDELKVTPRSGKGRFFLLEVPLPAGGEIDGTTWGLDFSSLQGNFVEARGASNGLGYSIPIESIIGSKTFHQLVRFSSRGNFTVPPAKIFRMYRPTERAYEVGAAPRAILVK